MSQENVDMARRCIDAFDRRDCAHSTTQTWS